jgi:hypothetical protein
MFRTRAGLVVAGTRSWLPLVVAAALGGLGCETSTGLDSDREHLIQTESLEYEFQPDWIGLRVEIPYVFTNRTGRQVYLVNCNGAFALHLEREDNGSWRAAWAPVIEDCLSPPIVIPRNTTFVDTLRVWGAPPGSNAGPQFDVEDPSGLYRIVWDDALSSFQDDSYPFGPQIPLDARISNRFTIRR